VEKEYGALESFLRSILLPVESKKALKDLLRDFFLVLLPLLTFGVVSMTVVSGSMYPTIQTGDSLLASNIYYGGKFTAIPFNKWFHSNLSIFKFARPQQGHIIVFRDKVDVDKVWVKRIIGVEGDTIQFKNGIVYINSIPAKLKFKSNHYLLQERGKVTGPFLELEETLPNGTKYSIIWHMDSTLNRTTPIYHVPKGCYFVVGDNRDNSADSRSMLGFISEESISGRVIMVAFHHSIGIFGTLFGNPILWLKSFDFSRFFKQLN
jgi:signal peptidase I